MTPHTHKPHPYRKHEKGTACATCGNGRGHESHTDPDPWSQSACMKRPPLELTLVPEFKADVIDGLTGEVIAKDATIPAHYVALTPNCTHCGGSGVDFMARGDTRPCPCRATEHR